MHFVTKDGVAVAAPDVDRANIAIHDMELVGVTHLGGGLDPAYARLDAECAGFTVLEKGIGLELHQPRKVRSTAALQAPAK